MLKSLKSICFITAKISGLLAKSKYSVLVFVINAGKFDLTIYYQDKKFQLNAGKEQNRTIELESFYQPEAISFWASPLAGPFSDQKFPVMDVLPFLGGSDITIFVGKDCKYIYIHIYVYSYFFFHLSIFHLDLNHQRWCVS